MFFENLKIFFFFHLKGFIEINKEHLTNQRTEPRPLTFISDDKHANDLY